MSVVFIERKKKEEWFWIVVDGCGIYWRKKKRELVLGCC